MRTFAADLRYSLRLLRKNPGFTVIATAALALGIGANTAIFSVIERVLLRPLPFPDSERIVQVRRQYPNGASSSISVPKFMAWRKCSAFQAVALYDPGAVTLNLGRGDRPDPISALHVTSQFFDVFGVKPMLGRTFTAQEDSPHAGNFVVLTFTAWKRTGGGTDIAGRAIELNGEPYAVLGVLPESYQPEPPADLYLPEQFDPNSTNQGHIYLMAGRLRPGVSMEAAKAELNVLGDQFRAEHPDFVDKNESVGIVPLRVAIGGDVRPALLILGGAVSFVLLIACANVANLLLARAAGRHRELAVRTAVGASRGRIVRQLLTESMVLALGGGAAGLLFGWAGVQILLAFSPGNIPRINDPGHAASALSMLDWRVLGFVLGVSVLTGVLFGLFPAIRLSRLDLNSALKEASGRSGTGLRHNRVRGALVIGEIALAVVLLAGAALMVRTFAGLRRVNPGFNAKNVLTIKTAMSGERYASTAQVADLIRQATERIEALPGVQFAGATITLPTDAPEVDLPFNIEGRAPKDGKWEGDEQWRFVSAHYMEALGVPLLRGRFFDRRDTGNSARVAIVNERFAKKYFPNQDPIGQRIRMGQGLGPDFEEPPREIVGVVGNITEVSLSDGAMPVMYVPQSQITEGLTKLANRLVPLSWAIRTAADPFASLPAVSRELIRLDPQLSPSKPRSMEQVIADSTVRENFDTLLLSVFASMALLLAAIGIYGLMSYTVEQRTQEIGIRMALGADSGSMLRFVLSQGLRLAAIGIAAGLAASFGLTRVLAGFLFGVRATDPGMFTAAAAILAAVSLLAAFVPARRATRVDPVVALRQE
jgi:predicted permease